MTFLWSINYVVAKVAIRYFPPMLVSAVRTWVAALLLLAIYLPVARKIPRSREEWTRREWLTLAGLGIVGVALNQICFITGVATTSVAHAALIVSMTPVLVLLLAWLRGQESLRRNKVLGMAVAISGVVVLNLAPGRSSQGASIGGDLLVFGSALSFALFTVAGKEVAAHHGSLTLNTFGFLTGAVALTPIIVYYGRSTDWGAVPLAGWTTIAFMAAFPSVVCYLIFSYALKHIAASRVASFSYSQPFIATLAGWAVLREPITLGVAAGGTLVLAGVYLTGRRR